ncbi:MAG: hypothetical protein M1820_009793 [Bogoriella megaspora]|nr:MAG: hypothetical protein M1820_009793 [Bogoriella megaspora]
MAPKRRHRKTRTGCKSCKERRVKCDEGKPSCKRCMQRGLECSFLAINPTGLPSAGNSSSIIPVQSSEDDSPPPFVVHTHYNWLQSSAQLLLPELLSLTSSSIDNPELDRMLLQTYLSVTAPNLSVYTKHHNTWSHNIPRLALSFPFLTDGLLAIGALHLSRLKNEPSIGESALVNRASLKINTAIPVFRTELTGLDSKNCDALFTFASLIVIFLFATSHNESETHLATLPPVQPLKSNTANRNNAHAHDPSLRIQEHRIGSAVLAQQVQAFNALRGPLFVISSYFQRLVKGPCRDILSRDFWPKEPIETALSQARFGARDEDARLLSLEVLWRDEPVSVKRTLDRTLEDLRWCFALVSCVSEDRGTAEMTFGNVDPGEWRQSWGEGESVDGAASSSAASPVSTSSSSPAMSPTSREWTPHTQMLTDRSAVMVFPARMLAEYAELILEHNRSALILLAYYTVLLDGVSDMWWSRSTGEHIAMAVALVLGDEAREWLEWPLGVIGMGSFWKDRGYDDVKLGKVESSGPRNRYRDQAAI